MSGAQNNLGTYVLNDAGDPVREPDTNAWARWLECAFRSGHRHLADHTVGPYRVSTVFLAVDYQWRDGGPPILWETMIFGLPDKEFRGRRFRKEVFCERYASKAEALAGHARAVKLAESLPQPISASAS